MRSLILAFKYGRLSTCQHQEAMKSGCRFRRISVVHKLVASWCNIKWVCGASFFSPAIGSSTKLAEVYDDSHSSLKLLWETSFYPGAGGNPYNGLYGEASPERDTFLRLQVYDKVGISPVEVSERVGKSVISVCTKAQKG